MADKFVTDPKARKIPMTGDFYGSDGLIKNIDEIQSGGGGGGGGGGVTVHNQLTGRTVANTHPISAITNLQTTLDGKVNAEVGKGLSTNDFTDAEKAKLAGLESSHFKGQFTSLAQLQASIPTGSTGDFAYVDQGAGQPSVMYIWDSSDSSWSEQLGAPTEETPASIKSKYESNPDTNAFTDTDKAKLDGLTNFSGVHNDLTGRDATDVHPLASITDLQTTLDTKVDKVSGKGLSTNDFTTAEKTKLDSLKEHYKGTYTTETALNAVTGTAGDYAYLDAGTSSDVQLYIWDANDTKWVIVQGGGSSAIVEQSVYLDTNLKIDTQANIGATMVTVYGGILTVGKTYKILNTKRKVASSGWNTGTQSYANLDSAIDEVLPVNTKIYEFVEILTPTIVKSLYESNADTNAFTDAEKAKLAALDAGTLTDEASLFVETLATIKTNYSVGATFVDVTMSSNLFTVGQKISFGQLTRTITLINEEADGHYRIYLDTASNHVGSVGEVVYLFTPKMSFSNIKTMYEANPDTNTFSDADKTKLDSLSTTPGSGVHNDLTGRDAVDAHPISAITDLQTNLNGKVNTEAGKGLSANDFTDADKTKLDGLENFSGVHNDLTGRDAADSHPISAVTDLQTTLDNKVDKVTDMGLSSNDFTDEEKAKLAGLEASNFKGEYTSLAELQTAHPTGIAGDYAYVDAGAGSDVVTYIWDSSDAAWVLQQGSSTAETPASIKTKYESNADTNAFTDAEKTKLDGLTNFSGVHNDLTGRDAVDAHPISAITDLQTNLDAKATPTDISDAITEHNTSTSAHSNLDTRIATIEGLIPAEATTSNQLADKAYVDNATGGSGTGTVTSVNDVEPDVDGNVELTPSDIGAASLDATERLTPYELTKVFTWTDFVVDQVASDNSYFTIDKTLNQVTGIISAGNVLMIDEVPYRVLTVVEDSVTNTKTRVTVEPY